MARKAGIDHQAVVATATRIADERGLDALTLATVAAELGIRSPSLYAHVEGLDGLTRLLALEGARRMATTLQEAVLGRTGEEALRAICFAYRRFAGDHPGIYDASQRNAPRPLDDPELAEMLATPVTIVVDILTSLDVPADRHIDLVRAKRAALHGYAMLERNAGFGLPDDVDASFATMVELLVKGTTQA